MRILIVGAGSIGQRHADLLSARGAAVAIVSRHAEGAYRTIADGASAFAPDRIILATATSEHFENVLEVERLCTGKTVLVEKPLFDAVKVPPKLRNQYFVAYNLRFHPVILELQRRLAGEKVLTAAVAVGSYLPDWRPGTDYRSSYSADRSRGGGVTLDLSHELDYLSLLLGPFDAVVGVQRHVSRLEIKSDDVCLAMVEAKSGAIASIHLDYLSRLPFRRGTIHTDSRTLEFDLIGGTLKDSGGESCLFEVETNTTYQLEHDAFLSGGSNLASYEDAMDVLKLVDGIERSSRAKQWVSL